MSAGFCPNWILRRGAEVESCIVRAWSGTSVLYIAPHKARGGHRHRGLVLRLPMRFYDPGASRGPLQGSMGSGISTQVYP